MGLGFYDDEWMSLNHTMANIINKKNIPVYKGGYNLPKNSTLFIVASGPSIDQDIEYIKKNKDNVVIFSCGTALKILITNGIVPDFQVETERTYSKYEGLTQMGIDEKYFKKIKFIGLNVMHPDVFTIFDENYIFCRKHDTGSSLVPDHIPKLDYCNPTATNGAVSFATELGFDNIYFFGVDIGYKDEQNHHSKDSVYKNKFCTKHHNVEMYTTSQKIKSNFGDGYVLSTEVLVWCKQRIENCIIENIKQTNKKQINYINCCDGGYIEYTTPLHSQDIVLPDIDKNLVLESIKNNFIRDSDEFNLLKTSIKDTFLLEKNIYLSGVDSIIDLIKDKQIDNYSNLFILLDKTFKICMQTYNNREISILKMFLRGTLYHFCSAIFTHSLAMIDKELSFVYINESFKKVVQFLEITKTRMKDELCQ